MLDLVLNFIYEGVYRTQIDVYVYIYMRTSATRIVPVLQK